MKSYFNHLLQHAKENYKDFNTIEARTKRGLLKELRKYPNEYIFTKEMLQNQQELVDCLDNWFFAVK